MIKCFNIDLDGINSYKHWEDYVIIENDHSAEKIMFDDVRAGLKELGGGHADIWDADTDELYAEIEV